MGPFETAIEGDYDELMDIVKECQHIAIRAGAPSLLAYIKVTYKPEGEVLTIEKKLPNIINKVFLPIAAILSLLVIWQVVSTTELVPSFMLPSPVQVVQALISDFPLLLSHAGVTLLETFIGLVILIMNALSGFPVRALLLLHSEQ